MYSMSLFKIPKTICDGINSAISKYRWGQTWNERKVHWINWGKLYNLKKKGGMAFRVIHAFNLVMLAKQAWRLVQETHSLFYRGYKAWNFPQFSFMEAKLGSNPTFVRRSLLQACEVLREGSTLAVGDGRSIGIWSHKWLPHPLRFKDNADRNMKVRDLIYGGQLMEQSHSSHHFQLSYCGGYFEGLDQCEDHKRQVTVERK